MNDERWIMNYEFFLMELHSCESRMSIVNSFSNSMIIIKFQLPDCLTVLGSMYWGYISATQFSPHPGATPLDGEIVHSLPFLSKRSLGCNKDQIKSVSSSFFNIGANRKPKHEQMKNTHGISCNTLTNFWVYKFLHLVTLMYSPCQHHAKASRFWSW